MKNRFLLPVLVGVLALFTTICSFADSTYVTKVTISKIINNTQFDLPNLNLQAHSTTAMPMDYDFPNRPYAQSITSPVNLKGVPQNCIFGAGINNFSKPYVGSYFLGDTCSVNVIVTQENDTTFSIDLEPK